MKSHLLILLGLVVGVACTRLNNEADINLQLIQHVTELEQKLKQSDQKLTNLQSRVEKLEVQVEFNGTNNPRAGDVEYSLPE